jgi:transcriptional regulator with XRE-family HTH domain
MKMARPKKPRTEFGERLFAARTYAKLSQTALARAVGMSQSTLAEAESTAQGSSKTAQIAAVTGVSAQWLADGHGPMVIAVTEAVAPYNVAPTPQPKASAPTPIGPSPVQQLIIELGELLAQHDHLARLSVAPLLQRLAEFPEERSAIALHVQRTLQGALGNEPAPGSTSFQTGAAKISTGK